MKIIFHTIYKSKYGKDILDYAKSHPEINWVFKPHPRLRTELTYSNVWTKKEVDDENYMKRQIHGNYTSLTPLGTAFELTTLVFLDAIVSELMEKMEQTESDLKARHTVLE